MLRSLLVIIFLCAAASAHASDTKERWVVYYGSQLPAEKISGF